MKDCQFYLSSYTSYLTLVHRGQSSFIEDVQHFLLECPNYHVPRETLRQSLLLSCGIADFDAEILLTVTDDEDLKDIRLNLNSLLVKRQIDNPSPGAVTGGN